MNRKAIQELFMIPALIVLVIASLSLRNRVHSLILLSIVCVQIVTHLKMLISHSTPNCNPSRNFLCNQIALIFGVVLLILFIGDDVQGRSDLRLYSIFISLYIIISHIIHIDTSKWIHKSVVVKAIIGCIIAFEAYLIIKYAHTVPKNFSRVLYKNNELLS